MPWKELYEQQSFSTLQNAISGSFREKQNQYKSAWERARYVAFLQINSWLSETDKMQDWTDLGAFPWEKKPEKPAPEPKIKTKQDLLKFLRK